MAEVEGQAVSLRRLTVQEVLASRDLEERELDVPEWGGTVLIRAFSKRRQQELRKQSVGPGGETDGEKLEMLLLTEGVIEPEFLPEHVDGLREKSAGVIDRIVRSILELSGMTAEAEKTAEKRFPAGQ